MENSRVKATLVRILLNEHVAWGLTALGAESPESY